MGIKQTGGDNFPLGDFDDELGILGKCVRGELTGEMWENKELLDIITSNGFLCSVDKDVNKLSVHRICWEIIDKLEGELSRDLDCDDEPPDIS